MASAWLEKHVILMQGANINWIRTVSCLEIYEYWNVIIFCVCFQIFSCELV